MSECKCRLSFISSIFEEGRTSTGSDYYNPVDSLLQRWRGDKGHGRDSEVERPGGRWGWETWTSSSRSLSFTRPWDISSTVARAWLRDYRWSSGYWMRRRCRPFSLYFLFSLSRSLERTRRTRRRKGTETVNCKMRLIKTSFYSLSLSSATNLSSI